MKPSAGQDDLRGVEWRYFWQVCQGEQAYVFRQFTNLTAELAISPNGRTLVIPDHALHIVDLASRKELYTLTNHAGGLRAIAFSPTGDLFISAGADDTIKFWETRSWREGDLDCLQQPSVVRYVLPRRNDQAMVARSAARSRNAQLRYTRGEFRNFFTRWQNTLCGLRGRISSPLAGANLR